MIANQEMHMNYMIGLIGSFRYGILLTNQDQAIKGKFQMKFIDDAQSLPQCGEGKLGRNQSR